jgi:uncharacterized membrane protein
MVEEPFTSRPVMNDSTRDGETVSGTGGVADGTFMQRGERNVDAVTSAWRGSRFGVGGILWAAVTAAAIVAGPVNPGVQVVAMLGMILLPGAAVLTVAGVCIGDPLRRLAVAAAAGVTVNMLVGFAVSYLGPLAGVDHPLFRDTQQVLWPVLLGVAALLCAVRRRDCWAVMAAGVGAGHLAAGAGAFILPAVAVVGAARVNAGLGNDVAFGVLVAAVAVVGLGAVGSFVMPRVVPAAATMYTLALTLAWSTTMRGDHVFGWDIQKEWGVAAFTAANGVWRAPVEPDAYMAMLSLTVMPAQLAATTGMTVETVLRFVFPMLYALIPALLVTTLRRFAQPGVAYVTTAVLLLGARAFPRQIPAIGRQEIALLLFAAAVALLTEDGVPVRTRRWLVAAGLGALSFTHYTTAYATSVMIILAWIVSMIATPRRSQRRSVIATAPVAFAVLACTLVWNLGVTPNGVIFDKPGSAAAYSGLQLLPEAEGGFVQRWVVGTSGKRVTVDEYGALVKDRLGDELSWLALDEKAAAAVVVDDAAPKVAGVFPETWTKPWSQLTLVAFQLVVLFTSAAALWSIMRWCRRRPVLSSEYAGWIVAALLMVVLLRLSGTAGQFYNPERGAVHAVIILAVPVAALVGQLRRPLRMLTAVAGAVVGVVVIGSTWGLGAHMFGGNPPAATSSFGEERERFVVSDAELATAWWLADTLGPDALVHTDRYGQLVLSNVAPDATFGYLDVLHPVAIDERAYIYLSRTNIVEGRARGLKGRSFAVWKIPDDMFDHRSVVYSTEVSRVLR